jgi:hypothetical protein
MNPKINNKWCLTRIYIGTTAFYNYINDLLKILEVMSTPILYAVDACVLISHANIVKFKTTINEVYRILDEWFKLNLMSLNIIKTYYVNFMANTKCVRDMGDLGAIITCANFTKFLGLTIQNDITWDGHIQDMIKKLNTAYRDIGFLDFVHRPDFS